MDRRRFLQLGLLSSALLAIANRGLASPAKTLREACNAKGFDAGIMLDVAYASNDNFMRNVQKHFSLAANILYEIEWRFNDGTYITPEFKNLKRFMSACQKYDLRPRIRQIYSHENLPSGIERSFTEGTNRNASQLEKVLLKRVEDVCSQFDPSMPFTLQVMDEILDNNEWIRMDPITKVLGDKVIEIIFKRARELLPKARLIYQEEGIDVDPNYFHHKIENFVRLLEKMRKKDIPCTGIAIGGWYNPAAGQPNYSDWMFRNIKDLGYDLHVTELTTVYNILGAPTPWHPKAGASQEKTVSKVYREVFDYLIDLGNLKEVTFWAPIDSRFNIMRSGWGRVIKGYKDAEPGILNEDFSEKKVYRQLVDLVEEKG